MARSKGVNMQQLVTPNVSIATIDFGMCLWWVQQTVGAVHAFNTAIDEWNANLDNHAGNPPSGLWVPIFLTMRGVPAGHVCWSAPDLSVYSTSSSTSLTPVHHASIAALNQYYGGKLTLLGWSEIVSNIRIVKEASMPSITELSHQRILSWGMGRNGYYGVPNALTGECDADLQTHAGEESNAAIMNWYKSDEGQNWIQHRLPEIVDKANKYDKLIANPAPPVDTDLDKENNTILKQILKIITDIWNKITSVFK